MKSKITAEVTTITPEIASALLEKNDQNRRVSHMLVQRYQRDMTNERWKFNGSAILVAETGVLLDGQHRLIACQRSKKPFDAILVRGLPEDVMDTIDAGRKRSAGDVLHIKGMAEGYSTGAAASARLAIKYLDGGNLQSSVSTVEIMDFIGNNPDIITYHLLGAPARHVVQTSALGAILFLGTRAPTFDKRAKAFVRGITVGDDLAEDDPRLVCRNAFLAMRSRQASKRAPLAMWSFGATALAWNAFVRQEKIDRIKLQPNKEGRFIPPDVLGGPKRGAGFAAVHNFRLHTNALKSIQTREAIAEATA